MSRMATATGKPIRGDSELNPTFRRA
jgi:hypothetical protein